MDIYIEMVKEEIIQGIKKNKSSNITNGEKKALRELMEDQTIVIRPADKGSGVVVLDTEEYIKKM